MIPVSYMTEDEKNEVVNAFADYAYAPGEKGLLYLFPTRQALTGFLKAMLNAGLKSNMVYTSSPQREGFIVITDSTNPMPMHHILGMFFHIIRSMGFGNFMNYSKHCQAGGASLETKMRKDKQAFIQVEMLAVKKSCQGQGHMRKLLEQAFALADEKGLPCILTTDAKLKRDKYMHLGMKLCNTRKVSEKTFLYDLIRE